MEFVGRNSAAYCANRLNGGLRYANPPYNFYPIGFSPFTISARLGSRNGGSASFSPSVAIGSSVAKPGPSVAISNRMPFGSRK
jgi:hypothetical protein